MEHSLQSIVLVFEILSGKGFVDCWYSITEVGDRKGYLALTWDSSHYSLTFMYLCIYAWTEHFLSVSEGDRWDQMGKAVEMGSIYVAMVMTAALLEEEISASMLCCHPCSHAFLKLCKQCLWPQLIPESELWFVDCILEDNRCLLLSRNPGNAFYITSLTLTRQLINPNIIFYQNNYLFSFTF